MHAIDKEVSMQFSRYLPGDRNPALVANTPASQVEIISTSSSGKHE
jgi:hypothetical protein